MCVRYRLPVLIRVSCCPTSMSMKTICKWLLLLALALSGGFSRAETNSPVVTDDPNERHFDLLTVGAMSFTNVWVHRQTNFNILIRHDGGIYTIKLTDLPTDELAQLKSQIGRLASVDKNKDEPKSASWMEKVKALLKESSPRTKIIAGSSVLLVIALLVVAMRRKDCAPED